MRSESPVLLVWFQLILLRVQALECCFAVWCEIWSTDRCYGASEESWLPFLIRGFPLRSLLSLLLFNLRLQICRERVLSAYYGIGDAVPELQGFVWQLFLKWRHNLGDGVQRVEVDDQDLLLHGISILEQTDMVVTY